MIVSLKETCLSHVELEYHSSLDMLSSVVSHVIFCCLSSFWDNISFENFTITISSINFITKITSLLLDIGDNFQELASKPWSTKENFINQALSLLKRSQCQRLCMESSTGFKSSLKLSIKCQHLTSLYWLISDFISLSFLLSFKLESFWKWKFKMSDLETF